MSIQKITRDEEASLGVSSLPNRPSAPSLYSGEAMTASELRAAFDRLPLLVAERLNALIDATGLYEEGKEADTLAALIATRLAEGHSLEDLFADIESGAFAGYLSVGESGVLQDVLNDLKAVVSLPNGFSDLRTYVDSPGGNVEKDNPLPVSGGKVFAHTDKLKTQLSAQIPSITGEVAAGDALAVSGDKVFQALGASVAPLDARISTLESTMDGMPFYFSTVTTEGKTTFVPADAMRYARLDRIEGSTKKSKNLFQALPSTSIGEVKGTEDGDCVVSVDGNGYITLNTPDGFTGIDSIGKFNSRILSGIKAGDPITVTVEYVSGLGYSDPMRENNRVRLYFGGLTFDVTAEEGYKKTYTTVYDPDCNKSSYQYGPSFDGDSGTTMLFIGIAENLKFKVMVSSGTQEKPFEPYFEGLQYAKIKEIKSVGDNLCPIANITTAESGSGRIDIDTVKKHGTYTLSCDITKEQGDSATNTRISATVFYTNGTTNEVSGDVDADSSESDGVTRRKVLSFNTNSQKTISHIRLHVLNYSTANNRLAKAENICLRYGTSTEYTPHVFDVYTIPEEVQALDGYGHSLDTYRRNYIDFGRKAYCQSVASVDLGTLNWKASSSYFVADLPVAGKRTLLYEIAVEAVCSAYDTLSQAELYENKKGVAIQPVTATSVSLCDPSYTDATALKAALSGVTLVYEAKENTLVDLAEHIPVTPYIEVKPGGYLEAITEDGTPAPFTVTYQIKNES